MRVRGFPFGEDVEQFLAAHRMLFVVEQNRDAQFHSLLTLETAVEKIQAALAAALQRPADFLGFIVEGVLAGVLPEPRAAAAAQRSAAHG